MAESRVPGRVSRNVMGTDAVTPAVSRRVSRGCPPSPRRTVAMLATSGQATVFPATSMPCGSTLIAYPCVALILSSARRAATYRMIAITSQTPENPRPRTNSQIVETVSSWSRSQNHMPSSSTTPMPSQIKRDRTSPWAMRPSYPDAARRSVPTGLGGQLLAAVAAGFHGGDERCLHAKVVEGTERGRRRTARRGDVLAQHRRVGAGVAQELGRPVQGLGREAGRDVTRQP